MKVWKKFNFFQQGFQFNLWEIWAYMAVIGTWIDSIERKDDSKLARKTILIDTIWQSNHNAFNANITLTLDM